MNIDDLRDFLNNFDIEKNVVEGFLSGKSLVQMRSNVYLVSTPFQQSEVHKDILLFIKLQRIVPTSFLLNFISKHSPNVIEIDDKLALNFSYGKDLPILSTKMKQRPIVNKFYLVKNHSRILGYTVVKKHKAGVLENMMNVGEFLREN